jgi:hypothetical protein
MARGRKYGWEARRNFSHHGSGLRYNAGQQGQIED